MGFVEKDGGHPRPAVLSFFSGCGFLDLGFEDAGFETVLANEFNPAFAAAYEHARDVAGRARPEVIRDTIGAFFSGPRRQELEARMSAARVAGRLVGFIGGPPCPDFSVAGKQAGGAGDNGRLTSDYFNLIGMHQPDFFLFENVRGLRTTAKHSEFFDRCLRKCRENGYEMTERTVNSIEYGSPQDRGRIIVFGFNRHTFGAAGARSMAANFPWHLGVTHAGVLAAGNWPGQDELARDTETDEPTHAVRAFPGGLDASLRELTVGAWFERNDVERHPNAGDVFKVKAGRRRMRTVAEGDTGKKSFKRLHRWRYSPTVAYGNNEVHLHPWLDRRISVAEALALQSLPKWFSLPPSMTLSSKFKTIGNGVPYLLARGLASSLSRVLGANRQEVAALPGADSQPRRLAVQTELPLAMPRPPTRTGVDARESRP